MVTADPSSRPPVRALLAGIGAGRSDTAALAALALAGLVGLGLLWWVQRPPDVPDGAPEGGAPLLDLDGAEAEVVVHVAGLVRAPGVHRLPAGARVGDALEAAGGPLPEAWLDGVNLARRLEDGEQLLLAARPDPATTPAPSVPEAGDGGVDADGRVSVNRASAAELQALPGIGPVMAERIVEHREQHGPFTAVSQLRDVHGIGAKTLEALVDLVSL